MYNRIVSREYKLLHHPSPLEPRVSQDLAEDCSENLVFGGSPQVCYEMGLFEVYNKLRNNLIAVPLPRT